MPIATFSESQVLLITIPMGKHGASTMFWDASEQQVLENWSDLSEKSHIFLVVFITLQGCSYLINMLFSTALQD